MHRTSIPDGDQHGHVDHAAPGRRRSGGRRKRSASICSTRLTALLARRTRRCAAMFRDVSCSGCRLRRSETAASRPAASWAATSLRGYSIELRFGAACGRAGWTLFHDDVLAAPRRGPRFPRRTPVTRSSGSRSTAAARRRAERRSDFLGQRGPLVLPPTRVVLRSCAVPADFSPDVPPRNHVLQRGGRHPAGEGRDLALMLDTGVGPLVLGQSAWDRVKAGLRSRTPSRCRSRHELLWRRGRQPIAASWSTLPRFALVDLRLAR